MGNRSVAALDDMAPRSAPGRMRRRGAGREVSFFIFLNFSAQIVGLPSGYRQGNRAPVPKAASEHSDSSWGLMKTLKAASLPFITRAAASTSTSTVLEGNINVMCMRHAHP